MPTALQSIPFSPRRRTTIVPDGRTHKSAAKKLPKAAIEVTAEAFMAAFQSLPGAVQCRIVEMIDEHEDDLDVQELAAARATNPEDFDPANAITLEEYMSQRRLDSQKSGKGGSLAA